MSVIMAYRDFAHFLLSRVLALRLRTPISAGRFSGTSRTFSSSAANLRAVTAGDYVHNIGIHFSQVSVRIVFTAQRFLSPSAQGRIYGIILSPLFSIRLSHSQICVLCVCGLKTRFQPFRLATLVCSSARCGYLTPYLSVPKRTDEFLIFQASKIGFPQKGLFVSRSRRSVFSVS